MCAFLHVCALAHVCVCLPASPLAGLLRVMYVYVQLALSSGCACGVLWDQFHGQQIPPSAGQITLHKPQTSAC